MPDKNFSQIEREIKQYASQVRQYLDGLLSKEFNDDNQLLEASRHMLLAKGKMIRPYILGSVFRLLNVDWVHFKKIAAAIELIHCYSLIHDDLPAMDNDDVRRGVETIHKKYNEAIAILVGDALHSLAFEVLADIKHLEPKNLLEIIKDLAHAIGINGMVGGQYLDLFGENDNLDKITHMKKLKTGRLIEFSCLTPLKIKGEKSEDIIKALTNFSHDIGVAYQIKDDILDVEGDEKIVGKRLKKDTKQSKTNIVNFMDLKQSKNELELLSVQAKNHLNIFGEKADSLKLFVDYLLKREK